MSVNECKSESVEPIDEKLARAGRLFLSAHDSDQIDGDILLSEARETVAALVEALKKVKQIHTETCWERRWSVEESPVIRTVDAALKAAGVVL